MLASMDRFLAILETSTFLISVLLTIVQSSGFQSNFGIIPKILDAKILGLQMMHSQRYYSF